MVGKGFPFPLSCIHSRSILVFQRMCLPLFYHLTLLCRAMVALEHPLLKDGGILSPLIASLAQWHLIDDPEQSLGSPLMDALKSALREVDMLKRALSQVRTYEAEVFRGLFC